MLELAAYMRFSRDCHGGMVGDVPEGHYLLHCRFELSELQYFMVINSIIPTMCIGIVQPYTWESPILKNTYVLCIPKMRGLRKIQIFWKRYFRRKFLTPRQLIARQIKGRFPPVHMKTLV